MRIHKNMLSILALYSVVIMGCSNSPAPSDGGPATTPTVLYPTNGAHLNSLTLDIYGTGARGTTVTVFSAKDVILASTAVLVDGTWSLPGTTVAEGVYHIFAQASGKGGALSGFSSLIEFTIDVTIPALPAVADAVSAAPLNDTSPILSGTAEPGAFLAISIDGATAVNVAVDSAGDWSYQSATVLTEGAHLASILITDAAGNANPTAYTFGFSVDVTAPNIVAPADQVTNAQVLLDTTVTDTGTLTYLWEQISGTGTITFGSANNEDTQVSADLDDIYTVRLTATDNAGNTASSDITVTWDTSPPTVNAGGDLLTQNPVSLSASVSDLSTIVSTVWSVQSGPDAGNLVGNASFTGTAAGTYVLRLTATDQFGYSAFDEINVVWQTVPNAASLYPNNGRNWNDYVKNNGSNAMTASDTACAGTETGNYYSCVHGGEKVYVAVTGKSSCTDLTASDALNAFTWTCSAATNPVRMISTGLQDDKNLSDLLDFNTPGWLNNSITVYHAGYPYFTTTAGAWWTNPVTTANTGIASGTVSGTIYVVTANAQNTYFLDASKVTLVVKPGITLQGTGTVSEEIIRADTRDFLWVEGTLDITHDSYGVYWAAVNHGMLRNIKALSNSQNTSLNGIYLTGSTKNRLHRLAVANIENGVTLTNQSHYNILTDVKTSNGRYGLTLSDNNANNVVTQILTTHQEWGVYIAGTVASNTRNNLISDVTAAIAGDHGVSVSDLGYNSILTNILAVHAANIGLGLTSVDDSTIANVAILGDGTGIGVGTGTGNKFTGLLRGGGGIGGDVNDGNNINYGDCYVDNDQFPDALLDDFSGGIALHNGVCATYGVSDFTWTTDSPLTDMFVGNVLSNDSSNTSDSNGGANVIAETSLADWFQFGSPWRTWSLDLSATATLSQITDRIGCVAPAYNTKTSCEANGNLWHGNLRIVDWALKNSDTTARAVLDRHLTGNAADTLTQVWKDTLPASQADCNNTAFPGSVYSAGTCRSTFLRNAREIIGDGLGNENGLCESDETCLYTPNIGAYQGHGTLQSAGTFIDGDTLTGIILLEYVSNGY